MPKRPQLTNNEDKQVEKIAEQVADPSSRKDMESTLVQPMGLTQKSDIEENTGNVYQSCYVDKSKQCIQFDSCDSCFHRECAGIKLLKSHSQSVVAWFLKSYEYICI